MSFLFDLSSWGFFLFMITFIYTFFIMFKTDNKFLVFTPIVLVGLLWMGSLHFAIEEASASLESFCLDNGFTKSNFVEPYKSYCLDQENSYLIEQEVRLLNDEWLLIRSSLSGDSDKQ